MNRFDRRPRSRADGRRSSGQATVEFALLLPLLVIAGLALVQVTIVADARVQLTHAARAGARAAAVGSSDHEVHRIVVDSLSEPVESVRVTVRRSRVSVEVTVRRFVTTDVAIVGRLVDDIDMVATAHMPTEPP